MRKARILLSAALIIASSCGRSAAAPPEREAMPVEWTIRSGGLGRQPSGRTTYVPELRALYPEADVSIESGHPGRPGHAGLVRFFVFRLRGEELFRTDCKCREQPGGALVFGANTGAGRVKSEADVWIHPVTANPRFRTERGVAVGHTVADLLRAYPEEKRLYYFAEFAKPGKGAEEEYVCFFSGKRDEQPRKGTVETIRFYVRPALGKLTAGSVRDADYVDGATTKVDHDARIVAIEPDQPCRPWHSG